MNLSSGKAAVFAAFCCYALSSCAGGKLTRIEDAKELPPELVKTGEKFEVKELAPVVTDPKKKKKVAAKKKSRFSYPKRRPDKPAIWIGEEQTFEITYLRVQAGFLTLKALPYKEVNSRQVYHVQATATTTKLFSLFYRLEDMVESFIDYDGLFSHRFHLKLDESVQTRNSLEFNDSEKMTTTYWNRANHRDKGKVDAIETKEIPRFPQDLLSSLYYLRNIPLPDGATISFNVVSEGKVETVLAKVLRRETVDTAAGTFKTIVVMPELKDKPKVGDSYLWLTDDDRRIPIKLEAKVKVGAINMVMIRSEPGQDPLTTPVVVTPEPSPTPSPSESPKSE